MRRTAASRLACLVLAAGGSRRLGRPKQLLRVRGRTLLQRSVATARAALPDAPIVVVLGAQALKLRLLLRRSEQRVAIAHNARWMDGLASSLAAGLAALRGDIRAVLVLLTDQPRVDARALRRLVTAWRRNAGVPAAAFYGGGAGVPAILPRRYWRGVRALRGDRGARALLRDSPIVTHVAMPEASIDIDTPEDAAGLSAARSSRS